MNPRRLTLARTKRPLLVAGALICFAAAAVLTPSGVRSQLVAPRTGPFAEPAAEAGRPLAAIVPAGDAFAPRAATDDETRPAAAPPPVQTPRLPALPQTRSPLANVTAAAGPRVTAIATGTHPTAIVDRGGSVSVVAIGDALAGSTIVTIDEAGIGLADGRRLSLAPLDAAP